MLGVKFLGGRLNTFFRVKLRALSVLPVIVMSVSAIAAPQTVDCVKEKMKNM